jgi:hypothetical protein
MVRGESLDATLPPKVPVRQDSSVRFRSEDRGVWELCVSDTTPLAVSIRPKACRPDLDE